MAAHNVPTSLAAPLAWVYAAVVLYASWYPFEGWRWPPGQSFAALLALPWPPWRDPFDLWANFLGYLPLGFLATLAWLRPQRSAAAAVAAVIVASLALSITAEVVQNFLPGRHPSLKDSAMNGAGAAAGALLALLLQAMGAMRRWRSIREEWFVPRSGGALALLALWPAALLVPAPLPLGLGQVGERLRELMLAALDGVPWAAAAHAALQASADATLAATLAASPRSPLGEGLATALGLLAPCMLAYSISRPGWHRAVLSAGATLAAFAAMTLSTLLNFGPRHTLAWLTPASMPALIAGGLAGVALLGLPRRVAAGIGLLALAGGVALAAHGPDDPFFALNLQAWEQGRFVHFHGMAQWIAWLWPYLAMGWLLRVLASRD